MFSVPFDPDPRRFVGSHSRSFIIRSQASSDNSGFSTIGLSVINENSSHLFLE